MILEEDDTARIAISYLDRHGHRVLPMIEDRISASNASGDWEEVRRWCRVRLRISRMLMMRERSEGAEWSSLYPRPMVQLPWTADSAPLPGPGPSVA